jgi:hypothetical protein
MPDRRGGEAPDNSAVWIVLGVVGGVVLLVALSCGAVLYVWLNFLRTGEAIMRESIQKFPEIERRWEEQQRQEQEKKKQQEAAQAAAAARTFLDDLLSGRVNAAYAGTTAAFQQRWRPQQLQDLLRDYGLAGKAPAVPAELPSAGANRYRYATATPAGQRVDFTVSVAQVGNDWRVDQLSVDGPPRKNP